MAISLPRSYPSLRRMLCCQYSHLEESWVTEWIRIRAGYVWAWKFFNPERKSCGFKNMRVRVDGASVSHSPQPLNRGIEDSYIQSLLRLKPRKKYSLISVWRRPVYNSVYCFKLKFRHLLAGICEDFTLHVRRGKPCRNESLALLFCGNDVFQTGLFVSSVWLAILSFRSIRIFVKAVTLTRLSRHVSVFIPPSTVLFAGRSFGT